MRVALLYFGRSRSIRHTYQTHQTYVYNVLKSAGIDYDVYMHLWDASNNAVWHKETGAPEDTESYALLEPKYFKKENQEEFLAIINMDDYFYKQVSGSDIGKYSNEWLFMPHLVRNHLCALESQRRAFQMTIDSGIHYDAYIVIRPDAYFTSELDVNALQSMEEGTLYVPDWDHWLGFNDRFAFGSKEVIRIYTHRLRDLAEFRRTAGPITSEKGLKLTVEKYGLRVGSLTVRFQLCRPNGQLG
jgi:hypothetical protein